MKYYLDENEKKREKIVKILFFMMDQFMQMQNQEYITYLQNQ